MILVIKLKCRCGGIILPNLCHVNSHVLANKTLGTPTILIRCLSSYSSAVVAPLNVSVSPPVWLPGIASSRLSACLEDIAVVDLTRSRNLTITRKFSTPKMSSISKARLA